MNTARRGPYDFFRVEAPEEPERRMTMRWKAYNWAFRVFGRTPLWPRLGFMIWR